MGRFTNPRDLYFGEGARHEVKNLKGKKAIIVSGGSSMRRGGFLQDVEADLKEAGMEVKLFEGVESDPSIETVMKGAEAMREFEPDWIIAIGGGSPIDAAKAMWVFYEYPEESFDNIIQPFSFPELRQKLTSAPSPLPPVPLPRSLPSPSLPTTPRASSTRWPTSTSPLMSPSSTPSSPTPCPPSCALTPAWTL